jgi:hypothetical protein
MLEDGLEQSMVENFLIDLTEDFLHKRELHRLKNGLKNTE